MKRKISVILAFVLMLTLFVPFAVSAVDSAYNYRNEGVYYIKDTNTLRIVGTVTNEDVLATEVKWAITISDAATNATLRIEDNYDDTAIEDGKLIIEITSSKFANYANLKYHLVIGGNILPVVFAGTVDTSVEDNTPPSGADDPSKFVATNIALMVDVDAGKLITSGKSNAQKVVINVKDENDIILSYTEVAVMDGKFEAEVPYAYEIGKTYTVLYSSSNASLDMVKKEISTFVTNFKAEYTYDANTADQTLTISGKAKDAVNVNIVNSIGDVVMTKTLVPVEGVVNEVIKIEAGEDGKFNIPCGKYVVSAVKEGFASIDVAVQIHNLVIDEGKDATCTEAGKTQGLHCAVCGEVVVAQKVEEAGHLYEDVEAKDATCTEDGHTAGKTCSRCGDTDVTTLPATGHTYGDWVEANGKREKTCTVCGDVVSEALPGLSGGIIALIVIAVVLVLGGGGFALYWFVLRKKK